MRNLLGTNEALILAALCSGSEATLAEIAERLDDDMIGRNIDDGSIYMALRRMAERGYVTIRKTNVVSADGRPRDIGIYKITKSGAHALAKFSHEAAAVSRLRIAYE